MSRKGNVGDLLGAAALGASAFAAFLSAMQISYRPAAAFQGSLLSGMVSVWNQMADRLGAEDYVLLGKLAGGEAAGGEALPCGSFLSVLLILLISFSWVVIRSRFRPLLLLYVIPLIVSGFCLRILPGEAAACCFAAGLLAAWAAMGEGGPLRVSAFGLLAIVLGISLLSSGAISLHPSDGIERAGQWIRDTAAERYGSNPLKDGHILSLSGRSLTRSRGNKDRVRQVLSGKMSSDSRTALAVTMEKPQSLYLKGFVGERWKKGRWERLSPEIYYKSREDLYWLNRQGFDGLSQMSVASGLAGNKGTKHRITVKVKAACSADIYIPYEVGDTFQQIPPGTKSYFGASLGTDRVFGTKKYSYSAADTLTGEWTEWASRLYTREQDKETGEYFINESHFNAFVYENYREIPTELKKRLNTELGDPGDLRKNHADYKETIKKVRSYLAEKYTYSESFKASGSRKDPLLSFVKTRKGCDAHYASLAVMLFRYYGIPARYVEGYLITPADAASAKSGETIGVGRDHMHAWTEIYIDGYGFVPLETCPQYEGIMQEADLTKGLEAVRYETKLELKKKSEQDSPSREGNAGTHRKLLRRVLMILLGIPLAILLLWLLYLTGRRLWQELKWRRAFSQREPKAGTAAMFRYMKIRELPVTEKAEELGNYAVYSPGDVTEEQRSFMRDEVKRGRAKKKKNKKDKKRKKKAKISRGDKAWNGRESENM